MWNRQVIFQRRACVSALLIPGHAERTAAPPIDIKTLLIFLLDMSTVRVKPVPVKIEKKMIYRIV